MLLFLDSDGSTQQLAGCLRDFRNKPFPVRAKIEYYQNTLSVCYFPFIHQNYVSLCINLNSFLIIAFVSQWNVEQRTRLRNVF